MAINMTELLDFMQWFKDVFLLHSRAESAKNRKVYRGKVYKCNFGMGIGSEERKNRPCVIVSNNKINISSPNVIVVPITHTASTLATVVPITIQYNSDGSVLLDGNALTSNIACVSKARLGNYITKLTTAELNEIDKAIAESTDIYSKYQHLENMYNDKLEYIEKLKNKIIALEKENIDKEK